MRPTMESPARQTRPARLILYPMPTSKRQPQPSPNRLAAHGLPHASCLSTILTWLSPACTKNACVTWHPAPSPPQHRDALTCPIPDTLSTNEPKLIIYSETRLLRTLKGNEKKVRSKQSTFYPKQIMRKKKGRLAMSVIDGENVITECTY